MTNKILKVGKMAKKDLIYKCSRCGNLQAMIQGEVASPCEICAEKGQQQNWLETSKHLLTITKNIKKEIEVVSEYVPDANNKFLVTLKLLNKEESLIEIKIPAETNSEARNLCSNWKNNYDSMYGEIINVLKK